MSHNGKYALTEILICGDCGTPYRRVTWTQYGKGKNAHKKTVRHMWRCINRIDYNTKYCPKSPSIEESKIHNAIVSAISNLCHDNRYVVDILKNNVQAVMEADSNNINPFVIENRIKELQKAMMNLVAISAKAENTDSFDDQFKQISEEIKMHRDTLEQYNSQKQADNTMNNKVQSILELIDNTSLEITQYDDNLTRQLIDTIKVMSENKLLIIFKGGFEMEQSM